MHNAPFSSPQIVGLIRFSLVTRKPQLSWELARSRTHDEFLRDLFAPERMEKRFALFETVVLPSLDNQTYGDFLIFVMASSLMPESYQSRLRLLQQNRPYLRLNFLPAELTVMEAAKHVCSEELHGGRPTLTFRLDDDDALCSSFVQQLANRVRAGVQDGMVITLPRGIYLKAQGGDLLLGPLMYPCVGIGLARYSLTWDGKSIYSAGNHARIDKELIVEVDDGRPAWIRSVYDESDSRIHRDVFRKHVKKADIVRLGHDECDVVLGADFRGLKALDILAALEMGSGSDDNPFGSPDVQK